MGRVFKFLVFLAIIGGLAVVGNAIFSELEPDTREIVVPIDTATE